MSDEGVKSILEDMFRVSSFYNRLTSPTEEIDAEVQEGLMRLARWDVTTSYPLTLKLYDAYDRCQITKEDFVQCLFNIESFVVRRMVCRVPTNQLKRIFLQGAKEFACANTLAWLRDFLSSGTAGRRWPGDVEFRQAWPRYNMYSVHWRCKQILMSLERSYGHKEPAAFDDATIEHVMPQTLTLDWRDMIASDGNPDDIHAILVDTIGNLTLTAYNPEL